MATTNALIGLMLYTDPSGPATTWSNNLDTGTSKAQQSAPGDAPVKMLDMRHPVYAARIECWMDLELLFNTGSELKKHGERLLKRRPREDQDVFMARLERLTHQPILSTAIGWYKSAMFKTDPEFFFNKQKFGAVDEQGDPVPKTPFYDDFLLNCTANGKSYVDFFKDVFTNTVVYGLSWILTDVKSVQDPDNMPKNMQEEIAIGIRDPHLVEFSAMQVINWSEDQLGVLEWAVVKVTSQRQQFLEKPQIVDTWYYYDRQEYRVYEDNRADLSISVGGDTIGRFAKLVRRGRHALAEKNQVPLRKIEVESGLWLANRSYLLLLDHLNQDNTLSWALFMSNLAVPVIIGDIDASNQTSSEVGYLQFPSGTTYQWSEPDGKSFMVSADRLESLREEAFRCMHLQAQGRSMHATPAMQSGRSKIMEMVPAHEVLTMLGSNLRTNMQLVLGDVTAARGDTSMEADVRGFTFDDDMTAEEVFAVSSVLALGIPSKRFEKFLLSKVAKLWMRNANPDQIRAVYEEIWNAPTLSEQADEDLKKRIDLVKTGMGQALQKVNSPGLIKTTAGGGAPGSGKLPPGMGGASNPNSTDVNAGYVGE